jgi:Transposase DDE domain
VYRNGLCINCASAYVCRQDAIPILPLPSSIANRSRRSKKEGQRGYDGSNKIKGRKRHIAVDTMGWPLAVAVHSAGISDTRGAHLVLLRLFLVLPQLLKFLLDGGYKQGLIEWSKAMFGYIIEVVKRPQLHIFKLLPSGGTLS